MVVRWSLTEKGEDTLPILLHFIAFGSKWYAKRVFEDRKPRSLQEIFTRPEAKEMVERLFNSRTRSDRGSRGHFCDGTFLLLKLHAIRLCL